MEYITQDKASEIKQKKKLGATNSELMKEYKLTYGELRNILDN